MNEITDKVMLQGFRVHDYIKLLQQNQHRSITHNMEFDVWVAKLLDTIKVAHDGGPILAITVQDVPIEFLKNQPRGRVDFTANPPLAQDGMYSPFEEFGRYASARAYIATNVAVVDITRGMHKDLATFARGAEHSLLLYLYAADMKYRWLVRREMLDSRWRKVTWAYDESTTDLLHRYADIRIASRRLLLTQWEHPLIQEYDIPEEQLRQAMADHLSSRYGARIAYSIDALDDESYIAEVDARIGDTTASAPEAATRYPYAKATPTPPRYTRTTGQQGTRDTASFRKTPRDPSRRTKYSLSRTLPKEVLDYMVEKRLCFYCGKDRCSRRSGSDAPECKPLPEKDLIDAMQQARGATTHDTVLIAVAGTDEVYEFPESNAPPEKPDEQWQWGAALPDAENPSDADN